MATYPTTLPAPLNEGYSLKPADNTIRTQMDSGAARVRATSSARLDKVTLSWLYTSQQLATFRAWFDSAAGAAGGTAWFSVSIPTGHGGYTTETARFTTGTFGANPSGLLWKVTAEIECRN
jgi:hypothetical protein